MFMTLRDPYYNRRGSGAYPIRQYKQMQKELDELFVVPAMIALQQMCTPQGFQSGQSKGTPVAEKKNDLFEIKMDVENFTPEELTVKMVNNFVVVEGKHEEKEDKHGYISRQFTRRYAIPEDVKQDQITCNLSSDGVLILSAPRIVQQLETNERQLTINFTGQPSPAEPTTSAVLEGSTKKEEHAEGHANLMTA